MDFRFIHLFMYVRTYLLAVLGVVDVPLGSHGVELASIVLVQGQPLF